MNAYELADRVDLEPYGIYGEQAANMLRQQAERIERKQELIREQTALLVKQNNRIAELEKQVAFLEKKCLMIKPLDDSNYPFRALLKKASQ